MDVKDRAYYRRLMGAINVPRGMIEFRAHPEALQYSPEFRKDSPILL